MSWQILVGLSVLLYSINGLLHRVLMRNDKSDPKTQAFIFTCLVGFFGVLIAQYQGGIRSGLTAQQMPSFLAIAVLITLGSVYAFKGFKYIEASEHTILLTTAKLWSFFGAVFLLGETLTTWKILAAMLIIMGVVIAEWRKQRFQLNIGAVYVLIAAICYASGEVLSFLTLQNFDSTAFLIYGSFLSAVIIAITSPGIFSNLSFYKQHNNLANIMIVSINDTLATLFLFNAYQIGRNALQIGPIMGTQTIVTVILAYIFLRENDHMLQKIVGALLAMGGTILLLGQS